MLIFPSHIHFKECKSWCMWFGRREIGLVLVLALNLFPHVYPHPPPVFSREEPHCSFHANESPVFCCYSRGKKEVCYLDTVKQWFKYLRSALVMPQGSSRVWWVKKDELTKTVCKNWYWPLEEINLFNTFGDKTLTVFVKSNLFI